jgi:hypothetical protein
MVLKTYKKDNFLFDNFNENHEKYSKNNRLLNLPNSSKTGVVNGFILTIYQTAFSHRY